jgi:DNA-binding NarL/FixJ family response regulator
MTKKTSYGRIKETTVGGYVMSRIYRKMEEYEEEILRLRSEGKTNREISDTFGFNM